MTLTAYVITKPYEEGPCRWCEAAVRMLSDSGVFDNVVSSPLPLPARQHYYKSSGTKTIPQIYTVDEDGFSEHIGTYDDLLVWLKERKL